MRRSIPLLDLLPQGSVLGGLEYRRLTQEVRPSGARYGGPPRVEWPVLPVQVFGVRYDLDLVLVDDHPTWDMHELARTITADGPVWLCKDSRAGTLEQTIVADVPEIDTWLPEIPLRRYRKPVEVDDRSTPDELDLSIRYINPEDEPVEVTWRGPRPEGPLPKRNSSTMGHSREQVLAALDLSHRAAAVEASIRIGGVARPIKRILGLVPFQYALVQTQAGFSVGSWQQSGDDDIVRTTYAHGLTRMWHAEWTTDQVTLVQDGALRRLRYVFARTAGGQELRRAEVVPYGSDVPACVAHFSPCLPDLARPLAEPFVGRYVLDVNGQHAHAFGDVHVEQAGAETRVSLRPRKPRWTRDRPLTTSLRWGGPAVFAAVGRSSR